MRLGQARTRVGGSQVSSRAEEILRILQLHEDRAYRKQMKVSVDDDLKIVAAVSATSALMRVRWELEKRGLIPKTTPKKRKAK